MNMRRDINDVRIIHNTDFEWGSVIEGKIYNTYFKVNVDNEGIPFDINTEFDEERLIEALQIMGLVEDFGLNSLDIMIEK